MFKNRIRLKRERFLRKTEDDRSTVFLGDKTTELPLASQNIFLVLFLHFRVTLHHFCTNRERLIPHRGFKTEEPIDQEAHKNKLLSEQKKSVGSCRSFLVYESI